MAGGDRWTPLGWGFMRRFLWLGCAAPLFVLASCDDKATTPRAADPGSASEPGEDPGSVDGSSGGGQLGGDAATVSPSLESPGAQAVDEEATLTVTMPAVGVRRFDAEGLPPGARLDARTGVLSFTPDFTQSGHYEVSVTGYGEGRRPRSQKPCILQSTCATRSCRRHPRSSPPKTVRATTGSPCVRSPTHSSIRPTMRGARSTRCCRYPPRSPTPARCRCSCGCTASAADRPPGWTATSSWPPTIPTTPTGTAMAKPARRPTAARCSLIPSGARCTSWRGCWQPTRRRTANASSPAATRWEGRCTHHRAPPRRHFAGALTTIGQTVPRHHHVARVHQLSTLWGTPEANLDGVWDALDLTRVLRDEPEARDQFISTKHGKDDKTIVFSTVVKPSPLTHATFYQTLETQHIGHLCMWDEGGHGTPDPILGAGWYDAGWSRMFDPRARLLRNFPFPAFSHSSANDDPGDDQGNGKVPWTELGGFAGNETTGGDTGWSGAIAGALNRFLRWDIQGTTVSRDHLQLPCTRCSRRVRRRRKRATRPSAISTSARSRSWSTSPRDVRRRFVPCRARPCTGATAPPPVTSWLLPMAASPCRSCRCKPRPRSSSSTAIRLSFAPHSATWRTDRDAQASW